MDFFTHQDEAKRRSRIFFVAFFVAVALAVCILYFVVTGCIGVLYYTFNSLQNGPWPLPETIYGRPSRILALAPFLKVTPFLASAIFLISMLRVSAIKNGGGAYIAEMLGGVRLEQPRSRNEQQFLNVVEEMAVASGLPRPRLYVMEHEASINAVTAGLDYGDTIIAVTQGALDHLDRDELQAVIAHEFAHIHNGDYALNLTMAGWLYGLLFFSARGKDLMSFAAEVGGRGGVLPLIIGLILWAGGWAGKLSAQLLEAAFSRQREYLADAFSAQFTRNPAALAGALKKIYGLSLKGQLRSGQALAMKSFFIVSPSKADGLLHTHPPLESRIERLDPNWDGNVPDIRPIYVRPPEDPPAPSPTLFQGGPEPVQGPLPAISPEKWNAALAALAGGVVLGAAAPGAFAGQAAAKAGPIRAVGSAADLRGYQQGLATGSLQATRDFLGELPEALRVAVSDPTAVPALILSLQIKGDPQVRTRQIRVIAHYLGEEAATKASYFAGLINDHLRLSLLTLAAPTLKSIRPETKRSLLKASGTLASEDDGLDLFEVAAQRLLKKYLGFAGGPQAGAGGLAALQTDVVTVLSFAAVAGCENSEQARQAFAVGASHFPEWPPMMPALSRATDSELLGEALDRLGSAGEEMRRRLLLAVASVVAYDQIITETEYDILRSFAAALEMPLPFLN